MFQICNNLDAINVFRYLFQVHNCLFPCIILSPSIYHFLCSFAFISAQQLKRTASVSLRRCTFVLYTRPAKGKARCPPQATPPILSFPWRCPPTSAHGTGSSVVLPCSASLMTEISQHIALRIKCFTAAILNPAWISLNSVFLNTIINTMSMADVEILM